MKDDTQNLGGLAKVEQTSAPASKPKPILKRLDPEQIRINPIEATTPVENQVRETLLEIAGEFDANERQVASEIVERVVPGFIQARAAQSGDRVAGHVRTLISEVAENAASQFPSFTTGSIATLEVAASRIVDQVLSA